MGFPLGRPQTRSMHLPTNNLALRNRILLSIASLSVCFLGCSLILSANTPPELRAAAVGTCYCHCADALAHRSCVKMCDSAKYAARAWANSCIKPMLRLPVENHDAGPRFPRLGRNERARVSEPATDKTGNAAEN